MHIISLTSADATLEIAGGKGANLARLTRAGFNVPRGFIIATSAYRAFVAANDLPQVIQAALHNVTAEDANSLDQASAQIRAAFTAGALSAEIQSAIHTSYAQLNEAPVAVRSSATAEDLPDMSFAGQHDTYLNILGTAQLLTAVVDCWSSLWTARAIGYRMRNGISHADAALAVVVQVLVPSAVSGVLFTANPLTGLLSESVIDATFGLGEALVSGQVQPDHFVVNSLNGDISARILGDKRVITRCKTSGGIENIAQQPDARQSMTDADIHQLVEIGQRIQKEYDAPQDIEWALVDGNLHILQSRAITSLYPIPRASFDPLIAWFSFGSVQGLVGPITPLGRDTILHVVVGAGRLFGATLRYGHVDLFAPAGERIWIKVSDVIRNPLGKRVFSGILEFIEPSVGQILRQLATDPRLGAGKGRFTFKTLRRLTRFFLPIAVNILRTILRPEQARASFDAVIENALRAAHIAPAADRFGRLANVVAFMQSHVANALPLIFSRFIPVLAPCMAGMALLAHLGGNKATAQEVTRGLPRNVTTEMDLALWETAVAIRADDGAVHAFRRCDAGELARRYLDGTLPVVAQTAIARFMGQYGMRGVGEIDFGQPRWREDPTPVMHTLQSYLQIDMDAAPDVMFARGELAARDAIEAMAASARRQWGGWLKEKLVRGAARRIRLLMGARESPKFFAIRMMGIARDAMLEAGREFVAAGTLERAHDLCFLTLPELSELAGQSLDTDWKTLIHARRTTYERELLRRQVPRVLVSDGRAFYAGIGAQTDTGHAISGSPVSAGVVEGIVHVVLDPRNTRLAPAEILVCPGTDPAWTPLFMTAGGLITEVGGMMTHGSVVAREYGIPAVVGVDRATQRLHTGQRIRLDGTSGRIVVLDE
jgi:phosphohistidine swiveling domain-containing protein